MVAKVGEIEVYYIDEDLEKLSKKERIKRIDELFKKEYQGKQIKYLLNNKEIRALINSITRSNISSRIHGGSVNETNKEFSIKQGIILKGDYIKLISELDYIRTSEDKRKENHINYKFHYFKKVIMCNKRYYEVVVDIREHAKGFIIYNTKIKEIF